MILLGTSRGKMRTMHSYVTFDGEHKYGNTLRVQIRN